MPGPVCCCHQLGVGDWTSVKKLTPTPNPGSQWGKSFNRQEGPHAETAQSALTVIFKLVIGGLTSIILIVLGTVNLQFQGPLVPISLSPVLRTVAAYVVGTVWS